MSETVPVTAMRWATRAEAAEYARVSVDTIDRWAREEKLTRHKIGDMKSVRFSLAELDAMITPVVTVPE